MPNNYFKFKQFTVYQELASMKVCTDACVFGAYLSQNVLDNAHQILDIGTGTGLLSLMIAQNCKQYTAIDAVELEQNAYQQAKINFEQSPFDVQISAFHQAIQLFESATKYDLIVSNPPFFNNYEKAKNTQQNFAKHTDALSFEALASNIARLLSENGKAWIMLPEYEMQLFSSKMLENSLQPFFSILLHNYAQKKVLRHIRGFEYNISPQNITEKIETLNIYDTPNVYANDFIQLLKPFYLHL